MNILWLLPEPPLPPYSGGRERARRLLLHVARRHAVHLVTYAAANEAAQLRALADHLAGLTALPYPARGQAYSAGLRASVCEMRAAPRGGAWHAVHVQGLGLWPAARAALQGGTRPRLVVDLFDVPAIVRQRMFNVRRWRLPWDWLGLAYARRREARALSQADAVIVTSAHDAAALRRAYSEVALPSVTTVPNGVDLAYWTQSPANVATEPATLIFPAALNYPPNIDAAQVLVNAVLPRVRARVPEARVLIAGRAPSPAMVALARNNTAVTLCTDPPDMRPLLARATLVVVPLRAGSGTRLKILQALAAGRPVVSTPLGAEGLDLEPERHLSIAPLVDSFAHECVRLLRDPAARALLSAAGLQAAAGYDWGVTLRALDEVYSNMVIGNW